MANNTSLAEDNSRLRKERSGLSESLSAMEREVCVCVCVCGEVGGLFVCVHACVWIVCLCVYVYTCVSVRVHTCVCVCLCVTSCV